MIKAIYKITNNINGKIYIGQTVHPDKRWWEHCNRAYSKYDDYPIHLAIVKYGKENFDFKVLEWTENYDEREKELIKKYNSLSPNGYNILEGGPSPILYGENNPRNIVKNSDVPLIINDLKENRMSDREIAKKYNLTDKIIADINHGYTHKINGIQYPIRIKHGRQKLTEDEANQIKELLATSCLTFGEIANMFNTTKINISQINNGRSFRRPETNYPIRTKPVKINQYY